MLVKSPRAWQDAGKRSANSRRSVKKRTNIDTEPSDASETYAPPSIEWVEVMEEAGVYAACAKDPFEPLSEGCNAFPQMGAS